MQIEPPEFTLIFLEGEGIITSSEKNLRSKISSIISSINELESKKRRIDFEIRRQKKSLARKRLELKRVTKSSHTRTNYVLESGDETEFLDEVRDLRRFDNLLLEESNRILEQ